MGFGSREDETDGLKEESLILSCEMELLSFLINYGV